jgi:ABC-type nitrate/sulfonate/bicarbonate transport system permease component
MSRAWRIGGPAAVLLALIALWWSATGLGWVDPLVLPSPASVLAVFWNEPGRMASNAGITALEAIIGLILGNACGLLLAILFVSSAPGRRAVLPLAMAAQAVPIVAVTPALIIGFGNGMEPKILVAIFLVFFPMLVNGMRGLRSADAEVGELMRAAGSVCGWCACRPPFPSSSRRSNSPPALPSLPPSLPNGSRPTVALATSLSMPGHNTGLTRCGPRCSSARSAA